MLKCGSLDCAYNDKTGKCFAKNISIDGRSAQTTGETTCASYTPDGSNFANMEFASDFMDLGAVKAASASGSPKITCDAMNCRFNNNRACTARDVEINPVDASCETFEP